MKNQIIFLSLILLVGQSFAAMTFVPPKLNPKRTALVVVIHGCLQSAEAMALGTGWNLIAERENLVVLYPQVPSGTNMIGCWNWYLPENQRADSGQLKNLRDQIQAVKKSLQIESASTFLVGISSGGATVSGLMACYPSDFAAGAVHSGPSYGLAKNIQEAEKVLKEGPSSVNSDGTLPCHPQKFVGDLIVVQGLADQVVHPGHADRLVTDFLPGSKPLKALEKTENGLSFSATNYFIQGKRRGRVILVKDLPHAWSGFNLNQRYPDQTQLPFFSSKGPSATNWIWEFFKTSELVKRE